MTNINGLQTIALLFTIIASYFCFLNWKRREFTLRELIAWELVWVLFAAVTLFPAEFEIFSNNFGANRPFDLFTILGFILTLSISFYTYVNVDRLRKKMEKTIREMAIDEACKK